MKTEEFRQIIRETPVVMASFTLTNPSKNALACGHHKGDLFLYHENGCMIPVTQHGKRFSYGVFASQFTFSGYVLVGEGDQILGDYPA